MGKVIRNYKDTVFCMLFRDKKRLLSLYNGMNGTHYTNEDLIEACSSLKEYIFFVERVREYNMEMGIERAVKKAIDKCVEEGILVEFLTENRDEVTEMGILEYDVARTLQYFCRDAYVDGVASGKAEGKAEAVLELLAEIGHVSEEVRERIKSEKDSDTLKKWLKLAAKAKNIEEFISKM